VAAAFALAWQAVLQQAAANAVTATVAQFIDGVHPTKIW
jgi:hypothetical protein